MLLALHIQDFALAGRVEIEFGPGLNVLTGETGAGKSIIIDAVSALIGGRVGADHVRQGRERAILEGAFLATAPAVQERLAALDVQAGDGDDTVILVREISAAGRSKCRINGRLANVSALAEIGKVLVDIHGQHDHQSLFHPSSHLDLLDALGGEAILGLREQVSRLVEERDGLLQEIERLREGERERARLEDLLTYQIQEIAAAQLSPGEDAELEAERARLAHVERIVDGVRQSYGEVYEGGPGARSAVDLAGSALERLQGLVEYDPQLAPLVEALEQAVVSMQEVAHDLRRYLGQLAADPERLSQVESRLEEINRLKRKYGATVEEILAFAQDAQAELDALTSSEERLLELERRLASVEKELSQAAQSLSKARRKAAAGIEASVSERLRALAMPHARFEVAFSVQEDPQGVEIDGRRLFVGRRGVDRVEFLFSANPGEEPRPLAKIASGGEMSRVALAIKATLAAVDPAATLIFDEVDAGIGGETAERVADALVELARTHQVLVVTHLAQIAARADRHLAVSKDAEGDRTTVSVRQLEGEERVWEIARMLDGRSTPTSFDHAKALLAMAQQAKTAS